MAFIYIYLSNSASSKVPFDPLRSEALPQFHVLPRFRYILDIS